MKDCPTIEGLEAYLSTGARDEQVASHVSSCDHCRSRLDRIEDNNRFLGELLTSKDPRIDLDDYEVLGVIERGGQALVYRGRRRDGWDVAIKVLRDGDEASGAMRRRF